MHSCAEKTAIDRRNCNQLEKCLRMFVFCTPNAVYFCKLIACKWTSNCASYQFLIICVNEPLIKVTVNKFHIISPSFRFRPWPFWCPGPSSFCSCAPSSACERFWQDAQGLPENAKKRMLLSQGDTLFIGHYFRQYRLERLRLKPSKLEK